jgi:hypothetical protein
MSVDYTRKNQWTITIKGRRYRKICIDKRVVKSSERERERSRKIIQRSGQRER